MRTILIVVAVALAADMHGLVKKPSSSRSIKQATHVRVSTSPLVNTTNSNPQVMAPKPNTSHPVPTFRNTPHIETSVTSAHHLVATSSEIPLSTLAATTKTRSKPLQDIVNDARNIVLLLQRHQENVNRKLLQGSMPSSLLGHYANVITDQIKAAVGVIEITMKGVNASLSGPIGNFLLQSYMEPLTLGAQIFAEKLTVTNTNKRAVGELLKAYDKVIALARSTKTDTQKLEQYRNKLAARLGPN